jgi:hypothetical protein
MSDYRKDLSGSEPTAASLERVWSGVREREGRRGLAMGWKLAMAALVVLGLGLGLQLAVSRPEPTNQAVEIQLAGGSTVHLEADAHFEPVGPRALALNAGVARFSLAQGPWVVSSRHLRLEVAAAEFSLEVGGEKDSLTVTRGEVRVSSPGLSAVTLRAGQSFSTGAPTVREWELLARDGDLAGAWRVLGHDGVQASAVNANPELRLVLSDVAAAGGDQPLSRALLSEVMSATDGGAERGLAAFTLGKRLLADERRDEARTAFQRSLELELPTELRAEAKELLESLRR